MIKQLFCDCFLLLFLYSLIPDLRTGTDSVICIAGNRLCRKVYKRYHCAKCYNHRHLFILRSVYYHLSFCLFRIVIGTANRSDDQSSACFAGRLSSAASQFPISCAVNECRPLFTGLLPAAVLFDFSDIYVRPCCRDNDSKIVHTLFTTVCCGSCFCSCP